MSLVGKIRVRSHSEISEKLRADEIAAPSSSFKTPKKRRQGTATNRSVPASTSKKKPLKTLDEAASVEVTTAVVAKSKSTAKKNVILSGQKRIDTFFKSSVKTYSIPKEKENDSTNKPIGSSVKSQPSNAGKTARTTRKGKKRLFVDDTTSTSSTQRQGKRLQGCTPTKAEVRESIKMVAVSAVVDLCTDSEDDDDKPLVKLKKESVLLTPPPMVEIPATSPLNVKRLKCLDDDETAVSNDTLSSKNRGPLMDDNDNVELTVEPSNSTAVTTEQKNGFRKPRPCPPYKIVTGTSFAVDAFQYKHTPGITHFFLSHFHADHYVGLTKGFAMPIYLSKITANLVRNMFGVSHEYLHEMELNVPYKLEGVEVTAIDANHCPGAVMFIFKLSSGQCILHTGDFRACGDMESEPIFWNNNIDTIYLDTTYISDKYSFCTQHESIDRAIALIEQFHRKHEGKRILHVCGSYLIGKEKFWSALAEEFNFKVWTEKNRRKALHIMGIEKLQNLLCDDANAAQMHVISIGKLSYMHLKEYFEAFCTQYDLLLAIRPSGWEKNSRPQYRGQINIIGIEYSEHSSHNEMERFVRYLKPKEVISTVPVARNPFVTAKIPQKWYLYEHKAGMQRNFQPSITSYIKMRPKNVIKTPTKRTSKCWTPTKTPEKGRRHNLSQLSVRAMETRLSVEKEARDEKDDKKIENNEQNIVVPPDADAEDDWMS